MLNSDGIIVNLGKEEFDPNAYTQPKELKRWHCDGDVSAKLCKQALYTLRG